MSFEKVAREMEAAVRRQHVEGSRRDSARPEVAHLDSLVADLEEEVERRSDSLPAPLLARARSYLERARIDTGRSFPPRRRPGLVLDQVFDAAALLHGGADPDEEGLQGRASGS